MRKALTVIHGTLGVGNPSARHITLNRDGIANHHPGQPTHEYGWDQIVKIEAELATSWIPDPIRSFLGPIAITIAGQVEWIPEPKESLIRITTDQGQTINWDIDAPCMGGYSRKEARRAQAILRRLLKHPGSRDLLDKPEQLLQSPA